MVKMRQKPLLYFSFLFNLVLLLSSCGSSNKFTSSFGKRKYMRGYYLDLPSSAKEPIITATAPNKPIHTPTVLNDNTPVQHSVLKTTVIPAKISVRNNKTLTSISSAKINGVSGTKLISTLITNMHSVTPAPNETSLANAKSDINYWAIVGCGLSIAGVILTAIAGTFTVASIIVLVLAVGICIYSLIVDKFSFTWMGVFGLFIIFLLFTLILL